MAVWKTTTVFLSALQIYCWPSQRLRAPSARPRGFLKHQRDRTWAARGRSVVLRKLLTGALYLYSSPSSANSSTLAAPSRRPSRTGADAEPAQIDAPLCRRPREFTRASRPHSAPAATLAATTVQAPCPGLGLLNAHLPAPPLATLDQSVPGHPLLSRLPNGSWLPCRTSSDRRLPRTLAATGWPWR